MQQHQVLYGALLSGAFVVLAQQPTWALPTQVTGIKINAISGGTDVVLQTQAGDRPQIFTTGQGNSWIANITNAQLQLSQANQIFRQDNPAPGITSILVTPSGTNSIQVIVVGQPGSLMGQVAQQDATGLTLRLMHSGTAIAPGETKKPLPLSGEAKKPLPLSSATQSFSPPSPPLTTPIPKPPAISASPSPSPAPSPSPSPSPTPSPPTSTSPRPSPLLTSPRPSPPTANALPTSKINYTDISVIPVSIDLGTNARITRVVLREAPVREALAILARAADLGIVYTEDLSSTGAAPAGAVPGATGQAAGSVIDSNISLNIENEPIQDVFNYILRAKGLKANRVGKTVFIGLNLPATAGSYTTRTLRLNQMRATLPQTNITNTATSASSLSSGGGQGGSATNSQLGRNSTVTENVPYKGALQILEELGANGSVTARSPLFKGLQATADSRTNTLTLVGTLDLLELATNYLTRLDVRRKQVAVNIKIVEVDLTKSSNIGASFSFGIADNFFNVNQGQATANFGRFNPSLADSSNSLTSPATIANPFANVQPPLNVNAPVINSQGATLGFQPASPISANPLASVITNLTSGSVTTSNTVTTVLNPIITYGLPPLFQFPAQFLLRLQAQVTSGNAKILTDPTLIVQEGSQSQVNLTSQVFSGFTEQRVVEGNIATTRILPQPPIDVGLIFNVTIDQIDDSDFITLSLSPEVSSPGQQITDPSRNNLLIQQLVNRRRLETGKIRLRNGQTLILTGIIQETERTITIKTPILGDIPILNLLFRNRRKQNDRNEIVVLVTPQVLDDSDRSPYGVNYTPGSEVQKILQRGKPALPKDDKPVPPKDDKPALPQDDPK